MNVHCNIRHLVFSSYVLNKILYFVVEGVINPGLCFQSRIRVNFQYSLRLLSYNKASVFRESVGYLALHSISFRATCTHWRRIFYLSCGISTPGISVKKHD